MAKGGHGGTSEATSPNRIRRALAPTGATTIIIIFMLSVDWQKWLRGGLLSPRPAPIFEPLPALAVNVTNQPGTCRGGFQRVPPPSGTRFFFFVGANALSLFLQRH